MSAGAFCPAGRKGHKAHPKIIDTLIKAGGDPKKRDWSPVLNPVTLSMVVPAIVVYIVN